MHWDAVLSETSASWTERSGVEAGIAVGLAVEDGTFRFVDNFPGAEGRVIAKSRDHGLMQTYKFNSLSDQKGNL